MIAKIGRGSRIYGALLYNHTKVLEDKAAILSMHNMLETPDGNYTPGQLLSSFLPYLSANKKTEKTVLHVSLNPDPKDAVSDADYIKIANDYMQQMGYGDQPYIVFKHSDINRSHIHIVSTTVDKNGVKIPDSFEKKRSMEICRQLERDYNLTQVDEKKKAVDTDLFQPVDCTGQNIKNQIASVVRYLPKYYGFQTLGSYNTLLSLFNITAEHVKKEHNDEIKEGLVYFALDADGNKSSNPFKSSLFGKQAGLAALRTHFEESKVILHETKAAIAQVVNEGMSSTTNQYDFNNFLIRKGINVVLRRNEDGRLFGITFIDHNTKQVLNGSQLGKNFSANAFQELFSNSSLQGKEKKFSNMT
ncbi:conjugal transfer protein MobB [Sphingobacterium detergens]